MANYFTTIDSEGDKFVGTVYDANTNAVVYKSKPYLSQSQASQDINSYLTTSRPPTTDPTAAPGSQATVNTITYNTAPSRLSTGRCCGR